MMLQKGIVINNQDPEGRYRLQIFVPNISTTLFKGWNELANDIKIEQGNLNSLEASITDRLKKILPWAESSFPVFGNNGTTGYDSLQGKPFVTYGGPPLAPDTQPSSPNHGESNRERIQQASRDIDDPERGSFVLDPNNPRHRFIAAIFAGESGLSPVEATSDTYNTLRTNATLRELKSEGKDIDLGKDYGFGQNNWRDVSSFSKFEGGKYAAIAPYLTYGYARQQAEAHNYYAFSSDRIFEKNGIKYTGADIGALLDSGNYFQALSISGGKPWFGLTVRGNPSVPRLQALNIMSNKYGDANKWINKINNQNPYSVDKLTKFTKNSPTTISSLSGKELADQAPLTKKPAIVPIVPPATPKDVRTPDGIHSVPAEGSFVWVTFYNNDLQRPVYLGGVAEPYSETRTKPVRPTVTRKTNQQEKRSSSKNSSSRSSSISSSGSPRTAAENVALSEEDEDQRTVKEAINSLKEVGDSMSEEEKQQSIEWLKKNTIRMSEAEWESAYNNAIKSFKAGDVFFYAVIGETGSLENVRVFPVLVKDNWGNYVPKLEATTSRYPDEWDRIKAIPTSKALSQFYQNFYTTKPFETDGAVQIVPFLRDVIGFGEDLKRDQTFPPFNQTPFYQEFLSVRKAFK